MVLQLNKKYIHVINSYEGGGAEDIVRMVTGHLSGNHVALYINKFWASISKIISSSPSFFSFRSVVVAHLLKSHFVCAFLPTRVFFYHHSHISKTKPFVAWLLFKLIKNRVNIFPSEEMSELYKNRYDLTSVHVIYPPYDCFNINNTKHHQSKPRVGIVSRLEPLKRVGDVLEKLAENDSIEVNIFGDGSLLDLYRKKYPMFNFFGWVRDKSFVYSKIDLLVLNSEHETFSLILSECLYAGKVAYVNKPILFARTFYSNYENINVFDDLDSLICKLECDLRDWDPFKEISSKPINTIEYYLKCLNEIH